MTNFFASKIHIYTFVTNFSNVNRTLSSGIPGVQGKVDRMSILFLLVLEQIS